MFSRKRSIFEEESDEINIYDVIELIDEISLEIDDDYKSDSDAKHDTQPEPITIPKPKYDTQPEPITTVTTPKPKYAIPNFVKPISSINDLYDHQSKIGGGASGAVYLSKSKQLSKEFALKTMTRSDRLNLISFVNEINVLKSLNHPNIVNFNDAYITNKHYFITTEYCSGGTLHERIVKMKRFSEKDCVSFMKTILRTMQYIHSKNIVHRDLKLSNIVFDSTDINKSKLKIIDFGESEFVDKPEKIDRHIIGSRCFLPPEINSKSRRKKDLYAGDMWALGVIAYILVEGAFPYIPKHVRKILQCIYTTPLKWNENIPITDSCKDFIKSLLQKDIHKRSTAKAALQHPWITKQATDKDLGDAYFSRLQALVFQNKLQKVMVKAVLNEMNDEDKKVVLSHDGYSDDTELINTILFQGSSSNLKALDPQFHYLHKHTAEISDASLEEMPIDEMLAEIDNESAVSLAQVSTPPLTPSMDDAIPTQTFVNILKSSDKQYDIPSIVRKVTEDGMSPITFRKIAAYDSPMVTMRLEKINMLDIDAN